MRLINIIYSKLDYTLLYISYLDRAAESTDLEKLLAFRGDRVGLQSLVDTAEKGISEHAG